MTGKIVLTKGLPASGKTTWAKEQVLKNPTTHVRINNDDLREMLFSRVYTKENEAEITAIRHWLIDFYMEKGMTVIIDNTNLNPIHEKYAISLYGEDNVSIKEFPVDVETCIARDKARGEKGGNMVGEKVIRDIAKAWKYYPAPPGEFAPVVQNSSLLWSVVFDIDGTLANNISGRSPYDMTRVLEDIIHDDVGTLLKVFANNNFEIIICSGRDETARADTEKWLKGYGISYKHLYMRAEGDTRKDSIVKYEMLNRIIKTNQIKYWVDDRNQVVKMLREAGIRVLQVADGNF